MARHEHDREDLLADAKALVERASLRVGNREIFVGFRGNGAASFYWTPDCAHHFNARGELRRAFVDGVLYKAERRRLVALQRRREETEVALVRRALDDGRQQAFLDDVRMRLDELAEALAGGAYELIGRVPPQCDVAERIAHWLTQSRGDILVADSPRAT